MTSIKGEWDRRSQAPSGGETSPDGPVQKKITKQKIGTAAISKILFTVTTSGHIGKFIAFFEVFLVVVVKTVIFRLDVFWPKIKASSENSL